MPATFDSNVLNTISADAAAVGQQGFGLAVTMDDAGMSERLLIFETLAGAEAAQAAGDITSAQLTAITAAFGQKPRPASVAAGRVSSTDVAQVDTVTVGGTIDAGGGEDFVVTINGTDFTYTTGASETVADVVAGLEALINAGIEPVTAADASPDLTLTADVAGDAFDATVSTTSAAGTITIAETTANQSVATELAAVLAENSSWYAFTLVSRDAVDIERAAEWTEGALRFQIAQSSDADILTTATADIGSTLQDQSLNRTALLYYSDDDEPAAFAWAAKTLATDLDTETTQWAYKTLATIPVDDDNVTTTEKLNAEGKNVNLYLTLGGVGATGDGTLASGRFIDITTTIDWATARIDEASSQLLLDYANRNAKIPYSDAGFAVIKQTVAGVLDLGVRAGHFERTEDGASPFVRVPRRSEVSDADASARTLRYEFGALLSGGVLNLVGTGTVTTSTSTIALLAQIEST